MAYPFPLPGSALQHSLFTPERMPAASAAAAPRLVFNPRRSYPAYSLLVGACEDGRPLLMDLLNPHTGPVLVAGDRSSGKTSLLQHICASAARLNGPAEVRPLVITSRPDEWRSLATSQAYVLSGRDREAAGSLLLELGALDEQRRAGDPGGQAVLLFIDELSDVFTLDFAAQVQLHHLIGSGSAVRIWAFAAVSPHPAPNLHYWLNLFHTRLIGKIASPAARQDLAVHPGLVSAGKPGSPAFSYWDGIAWRSFWCAPEGQPA